MFWILPKRKAKRIFSQKKAVLGVDRQPVGTRKKAYYREKAIWGVAGAPAEGVA